MPPPRLMDELIGEILCRLPPDEPEHLVCKTWCRIVSGTAFRRGYREFHRTPPLLGFFHNLDWTIPRFIPIAASPCSPPALGWLTLDSRHGRVLIHYWEPRGLVVWDPVTGDQQHLPSLPPHPHWFFTGAVLCAAAGCDHLDCSGGPFRVVVVVTDVGQGVMWGRSYLSETGAWSAPTTVDITSHIETKPSLLTGDGLYFMLGPGEGILRYDLGGGGLSVIDAPEEVHTGIMVTAEDGGLGFAVIQGSSLHLRSRLAGDDNAAEWEQCRVIQLATLHPGLEPLWHPANEKMRKPSVIAASA